MRTIVQNENIENSRVHEVMKFHAAFPCQPVVTVKPRQNKKTCHECKLEELYLMSKVGRRKVGGR